MLQNDVRNVGYKIQSLKQWDIPREFRRRIKNAFEEAGIPLPLPQQQIWLSRQHPSQDWKIRTQRFN